jgi:hypothetical protein
MDFFSIFVLVEDFYKFKNLKSLMYFTVY